MDEEISSQEAAEPQFLNHVQSLLQRVAGSPSWIAPERTEELNALVEKHGIELYINDKGEKSFDMGTIFGKIFVPMRVLHHLWAAALFFAALYIEKDRLALRGKTEVNLNDPEIERVWANYLLSCKCFKEDRNYPPPPSTEDITPRTDYIELADELFIEMASFCILHEVAHLENGDSKTADDGTPLNQADPHEIEFAADSWAYDWTLSRCDQFSNDSKVFIKRTLGIIFSLAMIDEFRHHKGAAFASSHPEACDRLLRFFEDYKSQIASNRLGTTCLTASYIGLQVVAWGNNYRLPVEGYSDAISFLNVIKQVGLGLAEEAKLRSSEYERKMKAEDKTETDLLRPASDATSQSPPKA